MTSLRRGLLTIIVGIGVALGACSDKDEPPLVIPDKDVIVDGMVDYMGECKSDSDCMSGHCITTPLGKRCSRACSSTQPCPDFKEWSCTQSFCQCSGTGKQPTVCNSDGDCDGMPDKSAKVESCNDEDDDCNGEIDDVAPGTLNADQYFKDGDGDGFGDDLTAKWLCKAPAGWVDKGTDCDDTQKDDNPDATEICGDNRDNDCDAQKEDPDICGLIPIVVPDVTGNFASASLKTCGTTPGLQKSLDITEIVAKQDSTAIKFTIRLAGEPTTSTCTSYILRFGDPKKTTPSLVYVYRPAVVPCGAIPSLEVFHNGQLLTSTVKTAFNAADPGHVSFTVEKTEVFPKLPSPTYQIEACVNATADQTKDKTDCTDDKCETPVHR